MSACSRKNSGQVKKDFLVKDKVFAKADPSKVLKHMKLP